MSQTLAGLVSRLLPRQQLLDVLLVVLVVVEVDLDEVFLLEFGLGGSLPAFAWSRVALGRIVVVLAQLSTGLVGRFFLHFGLQLLHPHQLFDVPFLAGSVASFPSG
jgi:hypothetical protein